MENNVNTNSREKLMMHGKTNFDIFDSALACIMFIVISLVFTYSFKFSGIKVKSGSFGYFLLQALLEATFAVAAMVVVWTRKKNALTDTGMKNKVNGRIVGVCFCISLLAIFGFGSLTNVFMELLTVLGYSSILGNINIANLAQYFGYIISSCVIAAFCEEFLFRGVILSGFRKFGLRVAVLCSATIFMLMHGNAEQTIHQFIIGALIGYIFFMTNNLWIGFFIHMFNNLIPITEAYLITLVDSNKVATAAESAAETATVNIGLGTVIIDLIFALAFAWAGLYFIKMLIKILIKENEKINGVKNANDAVTSIVVDGSEQAVEMSIDDTVIVDETGGEVTVCEKPKISRAAVILFVLSGLYLVYTWMINTIAGFLI